MNEYALLAASAAVSFGVNTRGALRGRTRPRRILVVKVDHLGDVITATPALRALRDAHPDAVIDLVLSPAVAPLFEETPLANQVLRYESPRYRRTAAAGGDPRAELRAIAAPGYDTIVELRGDEETLRLPHLARARRRLDRGTVRIRDRIARVLRPRRPPLHEVETNFAVIRPLLPAGARGTIPPLEVHVPESARNGMRAMVASAELDPDGPTVTIHPGAAWRPRAWRPERFAAIADRAASLHAAQVVFVGSADERDIEAAIRERVRSPRVAFLFGTLALPEVAALLRASILFVGNDSGLAHLAAACGTRTIALFGAQDPRRFRPWSDRSIALHHPVSCFPCDQVRCIHPENPCVNLIEVSEVERALEGTLGPVPS